MSRFIVIEGLDGAGTTTQLARATARLRGLGHDVLATHEPTDGPVGRVIRQSLRGEPGAPAVSTLPWLFAADRADHLQRTVEPALVARTWVLTDRYLHSSLAYQSLELPLEQVWGLNRTFRVPDLTVWVQLDVDTCLARIGSRAGTREVFERRDTLLAVAERYARVMAFLGERGHPIVHVDGSGSIEQVEGAIWEHVGPLVG